MPQHLGIEMGGIFVADMMTSNRGGTHYDICWSSHDGFQCKFPNFNTGVKCQPRDKLKRWLDSRNDFIHAHRAIAAASSTAMQFLDELEKVDKPIESDFGVVHILLHTNRIDRGKITIEPIKDEKADLLMEIGTGPNRLDNAQPSQVEEFTQVGIDTTGAKSPLELALNILYSAREWMLKTLEDNT